MTLQPDTIAALATAPGQGAVAVVRMSGPGAAGILERVTPLAASSLEPRTVRLTEVRDPDNDEVLDQVLVTWFPGPASYTGEDVAEISCHGGVLAPSLVADALIRAGARPAEPGEFTQRAYLNGKMDLVQAEAVLDLVQGRSRALQRAALHQLDRGLSRRIAGLREEVIRLEAHLAHHLDFPEEDEPPTPVAVIARQAGALAASLTRLASTAPEGVLLRQGAMAVLAGPPNAGKSSLFNALAGEERALVTEVPGTTRDALEVEVSLGGYPFRLVDTAGLRETRETVERLGIEVAERYLRSADVVLFCLEAGREAGKEEREFLRSLEGAPVIMVRTKADAAGLTPGLVEEGFGAGQMSSPSSGVAGVVNVSAWTGEGLEDLGGVLRDLVFRGLVQAGSDVPVLTRERQGEAVRRAEAEVLSFAEALREGIPAEVASAHLKEALSALESVVGVVTGDEVLDRLFRSFCVGK